MCVCAGDMYRAAYSAPWVVMGRGNAPPPYTVAYYPEVIPYMGYDPSMSSVSTMLTATSMDASNMQDYSPKKSSWPNRSPNRCINGNKHVSDNSNSVNEFGQFRSHVNSASMTGIRASNSSCEQKNYAENEKSVRNSYRHFANNNSSSVNYRRQNMDGKGVKRHLTDYSCSSKGSRRSSSPCSDTDVQLLSIKRKHYDSSTPDSNRKDISTCSTTNLLSPNPPQRSCYMVPKCHLQEPCLSPQNINKGDEWDMLSCEIWNKYLAIRQTDEKYTCKMRLHEVLHQLLRQQFPMCSLFVVGSSMNGFGCNTSDIDMCLMLQQSDMDQTVDAINVLKHIQKVLNRCDYVQKVELIRAKVPILKFRDSVSDCEVDLNINNSVGIRNTHLLHQYSKLDWRVRPLVLIIKMWARIHDINDAKNMTVSSYSLTLMVIHYLQVGVRPPILPCLHKLFPKIFLSDSDVKDLHLEDTLPCPPSENSQSLGQLLVGFLNYFSNFQFNENAVSVRLGQRISKYICQFQRSRKNNPGQWKCLSIEEPFDLTNTARSVYDYDVFARIENVIKNSHRKLLMSRNLKSILLQ